MSQINKYSVQRLSGEIGAELDTRDTLLIESYSLGNVPFILDKYQLDAAFYTPDGIYLESETDLKTYSVLGSNQRESATEISVDPVQDCLNKGYLGDVQVEYRVSNNLFSPEHSQDSRAVLFIREISLDRTEIRATSTTLSENELQTYAQDLYRRLNGGVYFTGTDLHFVDDEVDSWCINVMTEVLDGNLVVAFKLYEPLPDNVEVKSRFTVVEQIGDPVRFEVIREVEVVEDEDLSPRLKGPNFGVEVKDGDLGVVTDYLNYQELFSYPDVNRKSDLYSIYKEQGAELSIDHSNYGNFVHFSSAAERLENFRYKLGLLKTYERNLGLVQDRERYEKLIQGIIDNFDHYERYLYFERTKTSWPKESDTRPYVNLDPESTGAREWFEQQLEVAQDYDENNPDILINTIPQTIRQDTRNEPYLVFVHMIGQHFDEEWLYAKAVSDRFNADNRLNFGLSKDLVREALKSFGIEVETTNQNLEQIFSLFVPGKAPSTGSESSVTHFELISDSGELTYDGLFADSIQTESLDGVTASWGPNDPEVTADAGSAFTATKGTDGYQPVFVDDYRKEIYKRIYHNIPLLLKTKGTSRGLRALISCFGIPESILQISVAGSANLDQAGAFFGPTYKTTSSLDRVKVDNTGSQADLKFDQEAGQFVSGTILTETRTVLDSKSKYQKGTHDVEIGFRVNGQFDQQVKNYLTSASASFDYDDIIGDPRNIGEDYGKAFSLLRNQILPELRDAQGNLQVRTPSAVLRLVRYFDSALFRTLQAFVPARDNVSVGAIVDDNILHRNRYKGLESTAQDLEEVTGSIETVYIEGGSALGVLRGRKVSNPVQPTQSFCIRSTMGSRDSITLSRECPTVDYEVTQSTGGNYVTASVFDDSPKFNGEFKGTTQEVTSGELNAGNVFKRGGSSLTTLPYLLDFRFLCLPRQPIEFDRDVTGTLVGRLGSARMFGLDGDVYYEGMTLSSGVSRNVKSFVFTPNNSFTLSQFTEIQDGFAGWYTQDIVEGCNYRSEQNPYEFNPAGLPRLVASAPSVSINPDVLYTRDERIVRGRKVSPEVTYGLFFEGALLPPPGLETTKCTWYVTDSKGLKILSGRDITKFRDSQKKYRTGVGLKYLFVKCQDWDSMNQFRRGIHCVCVLDLDTGKMVALDEVVGGIPVWKYLVPTLDMTVSVEPEKLPTPLTDRTDPLYTFTRWVYETNRVDYRPKSAMYTLDTKSGGKPVVLGAAFGTKIMQAGDPYEMVTVMASVIGDLDVPKQFHTWYDGFPGKAVALVPEFWQQIGVLN